ncbi:Putative alpha/Beta hydrolase [Septoria linicola]|uniref:Alpha/Beta hydrolase n=1 Tax=Septoria linicola TaxID=215465 RepID=A0A9Q9ASA8_9PEZI|nr:putative alpha/Beta hydrolase [Septoria linicola]USW54514.1 Putative alpha/Beta hydrolase [Septoria linicola]
MSLWGSKKKDDDREQQENGEGNSRPHSRRDFEDEDTMREPNERDRLLPADNRRPPHADGYLDPDDPAVSPYNLWTVRFMRYLTVLFLVLTFLWWVLLLVSIFVSPPGLHTRGSGFFDFSYTTLAAGILLNSLLFFSAPSLAMRVTQGVLGFLLLVNLIIIVSVTRLRAEEGAPGIASVAWVTLMAAWCISTDRVVAWAKREEEERLTGRPESRRTLQEWLAVFASTTILIIFVLITILMTATLTIRSLDAGLAFDGERIRVDDGKYDVHFACVGNKTTDKHGNNTPTVLIESGEDPVEYDFEHWAYNAYKNGTIDRYCYWDRPGYAWSDNAPSPHSAGMSADNLAEALARQGEEGPWILVSSGYGSIVSRIFSARNFREVVGIMLVDALHEDLLSQLASPTTGFYIWGWGVISPLGLRRIFGAIFGGQTRDDRVYGKSAFTGGKFIKAKLQENLVANSFSRQEISSARTIQAEDTPLVVISSGIHVRLDDTWASKQRDLTNITGKLLSWDIVNKAPHYVWHTKEGRDIMEKRLGQLVKEHYKPRKDHPTLDYTVVDKFRAEREL